MPCFLTEISKLAILTGRSKLTLQTICSTRRNWFRVKTVEPRIRSIPLSKFTTMTDTNSILNQKYPAKAHCEKVAAYLKSRSSHDGPTRIYLQGQKTRMIEDNDEPQPFRFDSILDTSFLSYRLSRSLSTLGSAGISSTSPAVRSQTVISFIMFPLRT